MSETEADAQATSSAPALRLVQDFLARKAEPLALLRAAGATVDTSFAGSGSYPFTAPHVAAKGSTLAIDAKPGEVAPETLELVLPPDARVSFDAAAATLGKPTRLPALPGRPWQYGLPAHGGRYTVVLDGDPTKRATVVSITAIRDR